MPSRGEEQQGVAGGVASAADKGDPSGEQDMTVSEVDSSWEISPTRVVACRADAEPSRESVGMTSGQADGVLVSSSLCLSHPEPAHGAGVPFWRQVCLGHA